MSGEPPMDVLVAGDLFLDLVMSGFNSWPPSAGEEVFAEQFCREVGGADEREPGGAGLQVIAVTGSVGKTTTKDLLLQMLSTAGPTVGKPSCCACR